MAQAGRQAESATPCSPQVGHGDRGRGARALQAACERQLVKVPCGWGVPGRAAKCLRACTMAAGQPSGPWPTRKERPPRPHALPSRPPASSAPHTGGSVGSRKRLVAAHMMAARSRGQGGQGAQLGDCSGVCMAARAGWQQLWGAEACCAALEPPGGSTRPHTCAHAADGALPKDDAGHGFFRIHAEARGGAGGRAVADGLEEEER